MRDTRTETVERLAFEVIADAANMNNGFPFRGEMAAAAQNLGRVASALAAERDTLTARVAELKTENARLRMILASDPAEVAATIKNAAGEDRG
jgi:hypothetical protein